MCVTRSVNCRHDLEILDRLSFRIEISGFLRFLTIIKINVKPGPHIVVMAVSTVANMFLTLFQAVFVNTLIITSQALPAL